MTDYVSKSKLMNDLIATLDYNITGRDVLQALQRGAYDIDQPAATRYTEEGLDTDTAQLFGVFQVIGGLAARSINVPGVFATRSEAWNAINTFGDPNSAYEVRPL